jgi:hypothetical protein
VSREGPRCRAGRPGRAASPRQGRPGRATPPRGEDRVGPRRRAGEATGMRAGREEGREREREREG